MFTLQQKVDTFLIDIAFEALNSRADHGDDFRFITGFAANMQIIQRDVIDRNQPPGETSGFLSSWFADSSASNCSS